jgi:hypothetical protein
VRCQNNVQKFYFALLSRQSSNFSAKFALSSSHVQFGAAVAGFFLCGIILSAKETKLF